MPLYSCAGYTPVVDPTAFVHPSANLQDHCVMHTFPGRVALVEENGHVGHGAVLHGCINTAAELDALITPLLDRKMAEISPIEHATMWIGVYEFQHCLDVPWRVVLNEYIELAKDFGGTDGYKYINGVLGGLAPSLRPAEVAKDPGSVRAPKTAP